MCKRIPRRHDRHDAGFTLIELLVVMIIIGILAAIAIPVFLGQRAKARDAATKSDIARAGKEIAAYYVDGTAALSGSVSGTTLTITAGATTVATLALTNGTVAPASPATVVTNLALTGGCTVQNSWYVTLTNPAGSQRTYYYGALTGLGTTVPAACG